MDTSPPVNPYIAGSPVKGTDMFFGREDVFDFVRRNLTGLHHDTPVVLYGQRRTGKTSVLYQMHRYLDPRYRCILIDLHGLNLNGMENLLWGIANSISRSLQRDHKLSVAVPDRATFSENPHAEFKDSFLDQVWSVLGEDHLVLMIDEAVRIHEEVRDGRLEHGVFDYLRHLMQHFERLNFIFSVGSAVEEMEKDYAFLFGAALYHRISFLEPAAARELIMKPVQGRYRVRPDAVEKILQITTRHPYYTQLVCHCLFDQWLRIPKQEVTSADVIAVLTEAIELGSANLKYVWEDSTPEEKAVMAGMAAAERKAGDAATIDQIRRVWAAAGMPLPAGTATSAIQNLTAREVAVMSGEAYSFAVDLQRLWLDKHRRLDWVKEELAEAGRQWAAKAAEASAESSPLRPRATGDRPPRATSRIRAPAADSQAPAGARAETSLASERPGSPGADRPPSQVTVTRIQVPAVDVPALAEALRLWYETQNLEATKATLATGLMVQCRPRQTSKTAPSKNALLTVILRNEGDELLVEIVSAKWRGGKAAATAAVALIAGGAVATVAVAAVAAGTGARGWRRHRLSTRTVDFLRETAPTHIRSA